MTPWRIFATLLNSFANDRRKTLSVPENERDVYYGLLTYGGLENTPAWNKPALDEQAAQ